jgi:anti-sigma B factor antagonist
VKSDVGEALVEVRLLGLPVEKWARWSSHHETIRRELDIVTTVRRDDLPIERIGIYLDVLGRRVGNLYEPMIEDLRTALHRGLTHLDLVLSLPEGFGVEAGQLNLLLEEINDFCREEDSLITVATPGDLVSFRRWLLGELAAQIDGAQPKTWDEHTGSTLTGAGAEAHVESNGSGATSKLEFSGELDLASAAGLQAAIQDAMKSGADSLTLDMRGVTFIDSVGLSLIVTARNRLDEDGGQLRVVLPERLRPLFDLSGLLEVLDVQFVAD